MRYVTAILAAIFCAVFAQTSLAVTPLSFGDLRQQITNQLTLASNSVPVDKKLISKLNATLKTVDKTKTDSLLDGTKTLGLVVPMLNKTSISNVFDSELQLVLDIYTTNYTAVADSFAALLANTFPGKKRDAAQKALNKLLAAIQGADTNFNSAIATKALATASRSVKTVEKAVAGAQNAKLPPASVTATISVAGQKDIKFSSKLAVAPSFFGGNFFVNAVSTSGSGFQTKIQNLSFGLPNLQEGQNNIVLGAGGADQYTTGGLNGTTSFISTGGHAEVVWISGAKAISGTFTFNALEQSGARTATITGTFTAQYQ